jgi:mannose-6-phosphate isomerase-like protein (cupin superfamily)
VTRRRGIELFRRRDAVLVEETAMQRSPAMDDEARPFAAALAAGRGSVTKVLFGDPDSADDGGVSLVWARFGANYHLPRHSHRCDCLYYVVAGELRMGSQTLGPGDGFFVPTDAPYGYVTGPKGLEVLEFRNVSAFDSQVHESAAGWAAVVAAVTANQLRWAEELAPFRS